MADEDKQNENEEEVDEEEEDEKMEEVDPETMEDGPRTIVVGEWSSVRTITEGLSRCRSGDTLRVRSGEYDEKVVLSKDSVELEGPVDMSASIKQGVVSTCSFTTITTMVVEGGFEVKCGNLTLKECDICNADAGVKVHRMTVPTITSCTFHDIRKYHIYIYPGGCGEFTGNTFTGSSADAPARGGGGGEVGLYLDNADKIFFTKNTITGVLTGVYSCNGCKEAVVEGNTLTGILGNAIFVDRQSKPTFKNNEIKDCVHYGVLVSGNSSGAVFTKNTIYSPIRVHAECRPSFYDNIVVTPTGKVIRDDTMFVISGIVYKPLAEMLKKKAAPVEPAEGEEAG